MEVRPDDALRIPQRGEEYWEYWGQVSILLV